MELEPAKYEITVTLSSGKRFIGSSLLMEPQIALNAENDKSGARTSGQEFDLMADWRVVDAAGKPGTAKVLLEAELRNSRTETITAWVLSGSGDEEKETTGPIETTPDGRVLFRVREAALVPDRVVALRVSAEVAGVGKVTKRLTPVLEFSASGHLHAVYPDDLAITIK